MEPGIHKRGPETVIHIHKDKFENLDPFGLAIYGLAQTQNPNRMSEFDLGRIRKYL